MPLTPALRRRGQGQAELSKQVHLCGSEASLDYIVKFLSQATTHLFKILSGSRTFATRSLNKHLQTFSPTPFVPKGYFMASIKIIQRTG